MKSLIQKYDRYLRRVAEETPASRPLDLFYRVIWPWAAPCVIVSGAVQAAGLPRQTADVLIVASAMPPLIGCYAAMRATLYHWRAARTPSSAPWVNTTAGRALTLALRRTTLRGLADVTTATTLQSDLGLTEPEVSGLLADLMKEAALDRGSIASHERAQDITVGMLLDAMRLDGLEPGSDRTP